MVILAFMEGTNSTDEEGRSDHGFYCRFRLGRTMLATLLSIAAINFLKLSKGLPLQSVKQIEGCSEIQHLRNCGSDVRSNRGPARWSSPFKLSI